MECQKTANPADEDRSTLRRWRALYVMCLGVLMMTLDTTIVNVALPAIRTDLQFSPASIAWVVNAYILTFAGFLLLGGRLGDLIGHRKLFVTGIVLFTVASLACGLAPTQTWLVVARAGQGLGGAVVAAVSLSLVMNLFPEPGERAKAMGFYSFVCAGGGSLGVLLGGVLTSSLGWRSIFLVNIPIGIAVVLFSTRLLSENRVRGRNTRPDIAGAVTITTALILLDYAIISSADTSSPPRLPLVLFLAAAVLIAVFLRIQSKTAAPLVPLSVFRLRNFTVANLATVLWASAIFAWFSITAVYLQTVQGYDTLQVAIAFLPPNLVMAAFSLGLSARLIARFGLKIPMFTGLAITGVGLGLLAIAPVGDNFMLYLVPAMALYGIGSGIGYNPLVLAALQDVDPAESGLASGVVNTSFLIGGGLGLAALASLAASRAHNLMSEGVSDATALTSGYQMSFLLGAACALIAAVMTSALLSKSTVSSTNAAENSA